MRLSKRYTITLLTMCVTTPTASPPQYQQSLLIFLLQAHGTATRMRHAIDLSRMQVAFLAGVMYTVVGLLRLGWITQYLSQPVISGFMAGASITIASSQV